MMTKNGHPTRPRAKPAAWPTKKSAPSTISSTPSPMKTPLNPWLLVWLSMTRPFWSACSLSHALQKEGVGREPQVQPHLGQPSSEYGLVELGSCITASSNTNSATITCLTLILLDDAEKEMRCRRRFDHLWGLEPDVLAAEVLEHPGAAAEQHGHE